MGAVARALTANPDSPQTRLLEARFHNRLVEHQLNKGEKAEESLQKAIMAARAALALQPDYAKARMELGQSLWRQARTLQDRGLAPSEPLRQAIEYLDPIPPKSQDYEYHVLRGLLFKVWADHEDATGADSLSHRTRAIEAWRQAIQLDEGIPDAWLNLGQAYLKRSSNPGTLEPMDDLEQARIALEKSRALNPQNFVGCFLGGTLHTELASRRRSSGGDAGPDLAAAVELFQSGIGINARIAPLHNGLGIALAEQAREAWDRGEDPSPLLAQAQAAYAQAIAVAPKQGWGQNNVGEIHATRAAYRLFVGEDPAAEVRAAEAAYQQALALLPGQANVWANLAKARYTLAAFELEQGADPRATLATAEQALRQASQLNPDEPQAWLYQAGVRGVRARWLGRQSSARANEEFEEAARAFEKALQLKPSRQDFRLAFGHFCREWALWRQQTGQDATAAMKRGLTLAEELLAARPRWPEALLLRASLLLAMDGSSRARKDLDAALGYSPRLAHWWKRRFSQQLAATP